MWLHAADFDGAPEAWLELGLALSSSHAAYEYGARQPAAGIIPQPLPAG